ncbi:MAG: hypothetical protein VSS75_011205 [Candidatus Parabeggiatoa sp.]|nr:hypothetical protein [Candidatus Parabeggiatoa sp.]
MPQHKATMYCYISLILLLLITAITPTHAYNIPDITPEKISDGVNEASRLLPMEEFPIWSLSLTLKVANVKHADTDERIYAKIGANGEKYYLNSEWDDFERGDTRTYYLPIKGGTQIKDISALIIGSEGKNAVAIKSVMMKVNRKLIFYKNWRGQPVWVEKESKDLRIYFTRSELRNNSAWSKKSMRVIPKKLHRDEIEHVIRGAVANKITPDPDLRWDRKGRSAVEFWRKSDSILHVDLDIEADLSVPLFRDPDVDVDIDFDIVYRCANYRISISIENLKTDTIFPNFIVNLFGSVRNAKAELKKNLEGMSRSFKFPVCPSTIKVNSDGSVSLW